MSIVVDCGVEPGPERTRGVTAAAAALRRGELVVLPTESVYGVAADAFHPRGTTRLRTARGSAPDLPLPVLVGSARMAEGIVTGLGAPARALIEAFWPGPLTLIARQQPTLAWDIGDAGSGTVSVRMPLHPLALEVLAGTGPLAVTGAHRSGGRPPRTLAEARVQLGDDVAVYLDAGACGEERMSCVVDVSGEVPLLLRPGAYPLDALREVCPDLTAPDA